MSSFWDEFKKELPGIIVKGITAGLTGYIGGWAYGKGNQTAKK